MLAELERILMVHLEHLMESSFMRLLIKKNNYHVNVEGLLWELENELKET